MRIRRNVASCAALLALAGAGAAACGDGVVAGAAGSRPAPEPLGWQLTPLQQELLMRPVSAEAAAGRSATRAELVEVRNWFGPGELEAVLVVVNRRARQRGADTLPHCLPLCDPGVTGAERTAR